MTDLVVVLDHWTGRDIRHMLETLKNGLAWFVSSRKRLSLGIAVGMLGLLLWSRLIVVSNMPRTAVADDEGGQSVSNTGWPSDKSSDSELQVKPAVEPNSLPPTDWSKIIPKSSLDELLLREEGKLRPQGTDKSEQEAIRNHIELIRDAIQHVRLESIRLEQSAARINGRSYKTGDRIAMKNFESLHITLVEVRSHSVILKCQDRRFELRIH